MRRGLSRWPVKGLEDCVGGAGANCASMLEGDDPVAEELVGRSRSRSASPMSCRSSASSRSSSSMPLAILSSPERAAAARCLWDVFLSVGEDHLLWSERRGVCAAEL